MFGRYFALGAVAMAAGSIAFGTLVTRDEENAAYHGIVTAVAGIAAVAYGLMAAGVGTLVVDGAPLFVPRYVDWVLTTPLIVLYLGLLADVSRARLAALVALDVAMVAAGPVAAVLSPPARWAAWGVGVLAEVGLLWGLFVTMQSAAEDRPASVQALFRKLRNLTVATWSFYPVVWLLGPHGTGVLLPFADVLVVVYLDVVAKVGFGYIAYGSTIALDRMATSAGAESAPT